MLTRLLAPIPSIGRRACARALHTATADFITRARNGALVTDKVSIKICNPGEAYVIIPPAIGEAFRAGSLPADISASRGGSPKAALSFFHETKHFGNKLSPGYPRLVIPLQLPRQSAADSSPASLFLYGGMQQITLDGTEDEEFSELASTTESEIGQSLELLKNM